MNIAVFKPAASMAMSRPEQVMKVLRENTEVWDRARAVFTELRRRRESDGLTPLTPAKALGIVTKTQSPEVHLLSRMSYGLTDFELEQAQSLGFEGLLDYQLNYGQIPDAGIEDVLADAFPTLAMSYEELLAVARDDSAQPAVELIVATLLRQYYSPRQLFEQMVEFWSNHFNTFIFDGVVQYLKNGEDREVIRAHALGNFGDMLNADARSPSMLIYLDNYSNIVDGPNENYARELLELHTLGVGGGYTEFDVKEVARAFTGWTLSEDAAGLFTFVQQWHDTDTKTILGESFPAGRGMEDGQEVLDMLVSHRATAEFVSFKLARHFVTDQPPASLVTVMADQFQDTAADIQSVLRTLFLSDEFAESQGQKFKRPGEYVMSTLRTLDPFNANDGFRILFNQLDRLGQVPFYWEPPTGYPDVQDHWVNSSALLTRWNFGIAVGGGEVDLNLRRDVGEDDGYDPSGRVMADFLQLKIFDLIGDARTPRELLEILVARVLRQTVDAADEATMLAYVAEGRPPDEALDLGEAVRKARGLIGVLLSSRYFQTR